MAYTNAPSNAWAGWRYRIQGGPIGGQYHGFEAPDEVQDYLGWPAGPREMFRPMDDPRGLGIYPWHNWNKFGVGHFTPSGAAPGIPLMEGATPSDFIYRSSAEVRPRPNASGGHNVVRAVQHQRTAGYAVAPGNYKTLGAISPFTTMVPLDGGGPGMWPRGSPQVCPAWGCGRIPWHVGPDANPPHSPAPSPSVPQPPPPAQPGPTNIVGMGPGGSSGCAVGQYRDAAGNCTSDWTNPYSMYLPLDPTPAPSPVVSSNTCPTGYYMESTGNCVTSCAAGESPDANNNCLPSASASPFTGIESWLMHSNSFLGMNLPNVAWLGVGFVAYRMLMARKKR